MKKQELISKWWWLILVALISIAIIFFIWHSQEKVNAIDKQLNKPGSTFNQTKKIQV